MTNQRTVIRLLAASAALSFATNVSAASVEKANDPDNLNLGSSWVGGTSPTSSDIAVWDTTVTTVITNALGQDTNWGGIQILSPGGAVFINADVGPAGITVVANNPTLTYTNAPANPLVNGDRAYLGGTIAPTGFTFGIGTVYYVVNATGTTFQLSATPGGPAITPTTAGAAVNVTGPFLTVGASGVDGSAAAQTLTLNCPVALTNFNGNEIWNLAQNVFLNGGLVGTNTLEKQGAATLFIQSGQSGPGSVIQVDSGIVQANSGSGTLIALNGGTFNVNVADGNPINVMAGGGTEQNIGGNRTWSGALSGSGALSVVASSIHTWNGSNTAYTGTLTESGTGSLRLSSVNSVSASTAYIINGTMNGNTTGIFNLGSLTGSGTIGIGSGTPTWSIGALNANSDFTGVIAGAAAIVVKTGTGMQNLSGANTYAGITVISNGVLQIGDGGSAGSLASTVVFVTNGTSVLSFNRGDSALNFTNLVTGNGTVSQDGSGTTFLSGPSGGNSANSYSGGTIVNSGILKFAPGALGSGGITFNNGAALQWAAGNTADISTNIVIINSGATLDANGNSVTLANPIGVGSSGSLTVGITASGGILNLQGANTYSGGTIVSSGALRANNSTGSATGSGNVQVFIGGTLGGAGTISGAVDIQGILAPGNNSVGTLTVGSLTLESGSTNNIQFNSAPANSKVVVTTSSGFVVNGGMFNLYQAGGTLPWTTPGTYTLFQYSGTDPSLDSTWTTPGSTNPHIANPQDGLQYSFAASAGAMTLTITSTGGVVFGTWNVDADGNWSDATKWSSHPNIPHAPGDTATLGAGSALRTVTLNANETNGTINFTNDNSFVIANGGKVLTMDNSGSGAFINATAGLANGIQTAVTLNDNAMVTVLAGKSLSVSGAIANASTPKTLTVSGSGTLALSGNNTYGPAAGTTGTTFSGGGTLQVGNNNALGAGDISIPVSGTLQAGASGLSLANNIDVASGVTATLDNNGNNLTLGGVISDSGSLTKVGNGTLTLSGNNTYSGNTTVNSGVLNLSADANVGGSPNIILNGGLLLGGTFELTGSRNIGVGFASGPVGTNALIDAASGQAFQVDGVIASAGNSGANNLIVNSLPGDNGTLVLNGANTFTGTTTVSNGVLRLQNGLGLQDSTLIYNSGTLAIDGSITAATLAGLTGTNDLTLTNLGGAAVTLTLGNNNTTSAYSGNLNDAAVGSSVVKVGNGTVTLSNANYTGSSTVSQGTLTIAGGTNGSSTSTFAVQGNSATAATAFATVSGGTLLASQVNVGTGANQFGAALAINGNATATFSTGVNIGSGTDTAGNLTINTTTNVSLGAAVAARDGGVGLVISNGTVTATSLDIQGAGTATAANANVTVAGGSFTIGDSSSTGALKVGDATGGTGHGGNLNVTGGVLTYLGTDGLLAGNNAGTTPHGNVSMSGGTALLTGITLNAGNISGVTSTLTLSGTNSPTLYLGGVGLVLNPSTGGTVGVTISNATIGAIADWSSSAPMTLNGSLTIQAADTNATAHNISLSGVLSGNGGVTKTGAGTATLSGPNTYTNNTVVSAGTLDLLTASLSTNSTVFVSNGATLQLGFAGANVVAGLVLNGVSKPPGTYNHGTDPAFLAGTGSIQVIAIGPKPTPVITHISVSGTTLTLTGTNGAANGPFVLLQSTNLATALTNWTPAVSNSFDGSGNLNLSTNIVNSANPREFYILLQ